MRRTGLLSEQCGPALSGAVAELHIIVTWFGAELQKVGHLSMTC